MATLRGEIIVHGRHMVTSKPWKGKCKTDSKMNTCMECYRTYSTSEALKGTSDMHIMLTGLVVVGAHTKIQ